MKKFALFLAAIVLSPWHLWSLNNAVVQGDTNINTPTALWGGTLVSAGWNLQIPIRESYSLSKGFEFYPGTTTATLNKSKNSPKILGRWEKIVVSIAGEWWLLAPNAKETFDQFSLPGFSGYAASTIKSVASLVTMKLPDLPVSFRFQVSSVVNAAAPVPGTNPVNQGVSFDPRTAEARTFFLMDAALKNGVKLTLEEALDFEAQSPILQTYNSVQIRTTLLYWMMGIRTIDGSKAIANQIPQFNETLFASLSSSANSSASAELRYKLLALMRSVLEYKTSTAPEVQQSWAFPTSRLYSGTTGSTSEYEHLYFKILSLSSRVSSLADLAGEVPLPKRELLADRAVEYLYGDHDGSSSLGTQYEQIRTMPTGTPPSTYVPTEDLSLRQSTDVLSNYVEQTGGSSEFSLTLPVGQKTTFSGALVYFPPSPNVINTETLLDPQTLSPLLSSVQTLTPWGSPALTLEFKAARKISSLLFWWGNDTNVTSVEYLDSGGTLVAVPAHQRPITYATLGHVNNSVEWSLVSGRTTDLGLAALNLSQAIQTTKIIIRFSPNAPRLYNIRGYDQPVNLLAGPSWSGEGTNTLAVRGFFSKQLPELFRTNGSNGLPYFLQTGGSTVAGGDSANLPRYLKPVSYLKSGLETPRSFSLKVLNNRFYKAKRAEKSRFPLTEFDLDRQGTIDFLYKYKVFTLPPKPYTDLFQFDTENVMYPYSYGIQIPTKDGVVTATDSPLYVEKLAGVDSMGMLVSLLKTVGLSTKSPPEFTSRFEKRVGLASYNAVLQGTPWSSYPAQTQYQWDREWFLRNSIVLSELADVKKGDLLVGYEGSELTVGIVVSISGPGPVTDLGSAQRRLVVVTVNAGTQRVTYSSWLSMSLNPDQYHIRRLVTTNSSVDTPPAAIQGFLHFSPTLSYTLELPTDTDQFRTWIPNTSELSPIGRIKLTTAEAAIPEGLVNGSSWSLSHVWDYYSDQVAEGNIARNAGKTIFHLVAVSDDTKETGQSLTTKDGDGFYVGPHFVDLYRITFVAGKPDYKVIPNPRLGVDWIPGINQQVLQITGDGFLYTKFALVAENPAPGEDIGLSFTINSAYGQWVTMDTKSPRLAVYDKKMLWRANLYIDEGVGRIDWNDSHPWITDNKWNRFYDGTHEGLVGDIPLATGEIAQANGIVRGGQVVRFDTFGGFTPFRNLRNGRIGGAITDSVSYDYDVNVNDRHVNAWDSPFDFVWKMRSQRLAIRSHFGGAPAETAGVFPNGNATIATPAGQATLTRGQLSNWGTTRAPYDSWKYYWKSTAGGNQAFIPGLGFRLTHDGISHTGDGENGIPAGIPDQDEAVYNTAFSAGVDCTGLVVRAAKYQGTSYTWTNNANASMTGDRAEGVDSPDANVRTLVYPLGEHKANGTNYADKIISWYDVNNSAVLRPIAYYNNAATQNGNDETPTIVELDRIRGLIRRVTVGDTISYGAAGPDTGNLRPATSGKHMAVITAIDYEALAGANRLIDVFGAIEVTESVYNQKMFFVFKRRMNQGPNERTLETQRQWNNWYLQNDPGEELRDNLANRYRAWSIQRLRGGV